MFVIFMNTTLAITAIALIAMIMVVGSISPSMATKDDNNGKAMGCKKANDNSKTRENNPHCNVPNQTNPCDPDGDGAIDIYNLADYLISQGHDSNDILPIVNRIIFETEVLAGGSIDGLINTPEELNVLNNVYLIGSFGYPACPAL